MVLRSVFATALVLLSAGFALVAWRAAQPPMIVTAAPAAAPPAVRTAVLVAARPLQPGTLLKDEDLQTREMEPGLVPPGAVLHSDTARAEMRGALLRRYIEAGAALDRDDVLRPRDRGFLAAVLRPSMRAIAVGVDAITGTAGLIWPGDQVDLILTQELDASTTPLARRVVGETVLTNVRVIAVDQEITQGATGTSASPTGSGPRNVARTVTLEVTTAQAERVAVAERLGRLALTVRPIDLDTTPAAPANSSVFGADVSPALSRTDAGAGTRIRVIQGSDLNEVTFR
ncbi:Flp pilus assembly protein CpaB [Roseicella aerolata]|uniref:Flp pilus assembly protein CpaB n=1 Tax=Roseicella aerolata TaxID=2883479 RepID=A0A9X1IIG2_9PROT|nr:Flp pilus assembly protein CpaB [Roseicella aerolata]MCB4824761.1 Flp pilus assembly protein CpaB [Roseicella aerolata]